MSNYVKTQVDIGEIEVGGPGVKQDETLTFAAADTFKKGTLLARQLVALAVTASAVTGTGDGTVSAATVVAGPEVPLVGAYTLRVTGTAANGGTWELVDPNGKLVASNLIMDAGAGNATVFEAAGMQFTITDGATDFAVGDEATLTVAADGKLVPYNPAGAGGAQRPIGVLTYEVTRSAAGDEPVRALVNGRVNKNRLIIDVDGDDSNITAEILDALRSAGVTAVDVEQLDAVDN